MNRPIYHLLDVIICQSRCLWYTIARNIAHGRYKLYSTRCDLCQDFTRPKAEWSPYATYALWDIHSIFHGHGFLLLYDKRYVYPTSSLWNASHMIPHLISHWWCNICGISHDLVLDIDLTWKLHSSFAPMQNGPNFVQLVQCLAHLIFIYVSHQCAINSFIQQCLQFELDEEWIRLTNTLLYSGE